jgi:hypothetical protein
MTDERDDLDRALSAGLADLAPAEPDATQVLSALRPRMQRARTRHRVLQGSAVAAVVLVLGIGAALASPSDKRAQVQVTNPSTPENTLDRSRSTSTTTPDSTAVPTPTTVPSNGSLGVGRDQGGGPDASTPVTTPETTPATNPSLTVAPDPGSNSTYSSDGGRVTVRFQNGQLSLVSYSPVPGFAATVHTNKPDDIEVRFSSDDDDSRIRVRVVDGRIEKEIRN